MTGPILRAGDAAVARAAELILSGAVVAYPTETLYGLAVDALDELALARLVGIKGRDPARPFPLLVTDIEMLAGVVEAVPPAARRLIEAHWPGALTLVLPAAAALPRALVGPRGGVGVRISSEPVARALVAAVGRPITATSANRAGEPPATCAAAAASLEVALVLDGGVRDAAPSTVVEVLERPIVLRAGMVLVDG